MRAVKRFVTVPVVVSICVALLWALCAIGVANIYPSASQSTSTYRLADFSETTRSLITKLQQERAAVTTFLAAKGSTGFTRRAKKGAIATDRAYASFRKAIGRFNSDDYGSELTKALKEADSLLGDLKDMRKRIFEASVSAEEVIEHYSKIISVLSKPILRLGMQPLNNSASDQSRNAYLKIVAAVELASRDLADGTAFVHAQQTGTSPNSSWRKISDEEKALLRDFRSLASERPRALYDAWSDSKAKSAADAMRNELAGDSATATAGGTLDPRKWFRVLHASLLELYTVAAAQQRDFAKRVGGDATRSAYLFTTLTMMAILVTLLAVAWFRPDYFRRGLLSLLIFGNLAMIGWSTAIGPDWLIKESGPLESLQAFALAAAFFIFCADTVNAKDAPRVVATIFTCACFLLFVREFDIRVYGAPEWLISISTGSGRRILFITIIAALLAYVAVQRRHFWGMVHPMLKWPAWPLLLWLPLLLAGELIEFVAHGTKKDDVPGHWASGQFWEELLELNAYLVLLFGAYVFGEIYGLRTRRDSDARLRSLKCAFAAKKH